MKKQIRLLIAEWILGSIVFYIAPTGSNLQWVIIIYLKDQVEKWKD